MQVIERDFDTENEAHAFNEGLELANDSDLFSHEPVPPNEECPWWKVYIHVEHEGTEECNEVCPACLEIEACLGVNESIQVEAWNDWAKANIDPSVETMLDFRPDIQVEVLKVAKGE